MLPVVVAAVAHALGIVFMAHAVMGSRTPQGSVAWAVSLVAMPYVAVPAYVLFGRKRFQGYVVARRSQDREVRRRMENLLDTLEPYRARSRGTTPAIRAAEGLAHFPALDGNDVHLLIDGEATFRSILDGIRSAREYILFQFYILRDDELGREVADALIAKAREAVRVHVLYDGVGSLGLSRRYTEALKSAGVCVEDFAPLRRSSRFQMNFRNHRKVVVVDGSSAWVGGHNVGDEYLGRNPKLGAWRDTHVRIRGPAALTAQISFLEDWYWAARSLPPLDWAPRPSPDGDTSVLILPAGPADDTETAELMFLQAINAARERLWIASPYFVPDMSVVAALQLASLRGVDVRLLLPERADSWPVHMAGFAYLDEVRLTGARFFRYRAGFLHQKVVLVDDDAALVGTANLDNRSFRLNFEITALVMDRGFATEVEAMLLADFARSTEVDPDDYRDRPWPFRVAARLCRLAAPVL